MNLPEHVDALITRAEAARDSGALGDGLVAAAQALGVARSAGDTGRTLRAGLLVAHFQYRSGALQPLIQTSVELLPLVREWSPAETLFDLLRQTALAGCDVGRFDVALPCAQEAQAVGQQIGDPGRIALGINAVACCFERMGDPWQAERLMRDALDIARRHGAEYALFVTLNNLAAVLIGTYHQLRDAEAADEAREALLRSLPMAREAHARAAAMSSDPAQSFFRAFTSGNLGEVLLNLGLLAEARPLLEGAAQLAQHIGSAAQAARIRCTLGELALVEGRPEAAWEALESVRLSAVGTDLRRTQMQLHHALWRTARVLQRPLDALQHLEAYLVLERQRAVSQLRAQSTLFVTRAEVEQARNESRRDQLTRLGNRREVEQRWPLLLASAENHGTPLAVAMLDMDHFKQINDRHGHAVGDSVLVAMAGLLRDNTRTADIVARVGGEEFLLVLPDTDEVRALEVCERLRMCVAGHAWELVATGLTVTLSIGLTVAPPHDAAVLSARADAALYRAKGEGRNRVVVG